MITPYTQPAEAPVLDTYVPIPFEQIAQAGAARQMRYDEGLAQEDLLRSQLDQYQALSEINVPGIGGEEALREQEMATQITGNYMTELDTLSSMAPDKSSPEFRSKARAIMQRIRKDSGPMGQLGIAQSNVQQLQEFQKRLDENPQLQSSPHLLAPFIEKIQQHGMRSRRDGVIERLDLFLGESAGQYGNDIPGLLSAIHEKGVTKGQIAKAVAGLIETDPEIRTDIGLQAQFAGQQGQEDVTATSIANKFVDNLSDIYSHRQRDIKTFFEPGHAKKYSKKILPNMATTVVMHKPGTEIASSKELRNIKTDATTNIQTLRDDYTIATNELLKTHGATGFLKDEKGKDTNIIIDKVTGERHDYTDRLSNARLKVSNAQKKLEAYEELEKDARITSGFTKEWEAANQDKIAEAERKAKVKAEKVTSRMIANDEINAEEASDWINDNWGDYVERFDERYSDFNKILKESSGADTFAAGVTTMDEDLTDELDDLFLDLYPSYKLAKGSIKDINTGKELTEDDFAELNISDKNKPSTVGFFLDDGEDGKVKLMVNLKDKEGNTVRTVKVAAHTNLVPILAKEGKYNEAFTILNSQLVSDLGALGRFKSEDVLTFGEGEEQMSFKVRDKKTDPNQQYTATTTTAPDKEGKKEHLEFKFADKEAMIKYIATAVTDYYSE